MSFLLVKNPSIAFDVSLILHFSLCRWNFAQVSFGCFSSLLPMTSFPGILHTAPPLLRSHSCILTVNKSIGVVLKYIDCLVVTSQSMMGAVYPPREPFGLATSQLLKSPWPQILIIGPQGLNWCPAAAAVGYTEKPLPSHTLFKQ